MGHVQTTTEQDPDLTHSCIQELPSSSLDIIGDIHGELEALVCLLKKLGYDDRGQHEHKRRLVFVGDLVDRGPDSPGVLRAVMRMVESGNAQCIAGNHEINAIRDESEKERSGEGWWYGLNEDAYDSVPVDPDEKQRSFLPFLRGLPGALEGESLRVVHACWHEPAIERLRRASSVIDAFDQEAKANESRLRGLGATLREKAQAEDFQWRRIKDQTRKLELIPELARYDEANQMGNAIKVMTSGAERAAEDSFWASGKWRMVERVPWWEDYTGPRVVMGHYWRRYHPERPQDGQKKEADMFGDTPPGRTLGPAGKVMCIDYSVGMRFAERNGRSQRVPAGQSQTVEFDGCLAALRVPEWELVFDDGRKELAVEAR